MRHKFSCSLSFSVLVFLCSSWGSLVQDPSRWTKILITGNSFGLSRVIKYASRDHRHGTTCGNIRATRKLLIHRPGLHLLVALFLQIRASILEIITRCWSRYSAASFTLNSVFHVHSDIHDHFIYSLLLLSSGSTPCIINRIFKNLRSLLQIQID